MTENAEGRTSKANKKGFERPSVRSTRGKPGVTRRQLLKGSAAAAPVVFTLTSRPVLAGMCISGPAMESADLSAHGMEKHGVLCFGRSPGYYAQNWTRWPYPANPGVCTEQQGGGTVKGGGKGDGGCGAFDGSGTLITDYFPCPPSFGDSTSDFMSVFLHIPRGSMESKLVCVLLNIWDNNFPSLELSDVQEWWENLVCNPPASGVYMGMTFDEWRMYLDSLWEDVAT